MSNHDSVAPQKHIAIIGTRGYPSYYGGFETAVRRLAPYLADQGWRVTVYGRQGSTIADDPSQDPRIESRVTRGIESRNLSTLSYGLTSIVDTARMKPDVALVMNVANGFWLPILRMCRIPSVVNVDGIEWERDKWSPLGKRVFKLGAKLTAKWASRIVVDSLAIGDYWKSNFGVTGDFHPYGGDRPKYPLPIEPGLEKRGYILAVARFVPENSIPEFIEAAEIVAKRYSVVIVGSSGYGGELDQRVAELARGNPRVLWLGHVSDHERLLSLWHYAGAYFHGHTVGGTNPALVQAMMCGSPILARDTVYSREVLGDAGWFVDGNPRRIAEQLIAMLSDPLEQERLSKSARLRAERNYSWQRVCEGYEASIHSAIEGK